MSLKNPVGRRVQKGTPEHEGLFSHFKDEDVKSGRILELRIRLSPRDRDTLVERILEAEKETDYLVEHPFTRPEARYLANMSTFLEIFRAWLQEG